MSARSAGATRRRRVGAGQIAVGLLLAGGSACTPTPATRLEPLHRLADELAHAHGLPAPPVAAVGDVYRYVLAAPPTASLFPLPAGATHVATTADGTMTVPVRCPDAWSGRAVGVAVTLGLSIIRLPGTIVCPAAHLPTQLTVAGVAPSTHVAPVVRGRAPAARRARTGLLELPRDAVLQVAIGLSDPRPLSGIVPARFRVRAEAPDGRRVQLYAGTLDPGRRPADLGWRELDVPLEAARRTLGGRVRLVFQSKPRPRTATVAFPVWGDPTIFVRRPEDREQARRNVVLISLDTLRADRLGCYGGPRKVSPALDALAARSTLFEVAIAHSPHTLPSHATMLTGLYPCAHGTRVNVVGGDRPLPARVSPLAEVLRRHDYSTAAFTEDAFVNAIVFQRGFGVFRENTGADWFPPRGQAFETVALARAWLRRHANERFFLFVHTYAVHEPYAPALPYRDLFSAGDGAADPFPLRPAAARDRLALYDGEIRELDAVLEGLLRDLAELGFEQRTIVVVTSDHGEGFEEHGHSSHGCCLHEEDLRIPFIWHAPGLIAAGRRVSSGVVGLIDVVPTLYALLGINAPHELQGIDLGPVLAGGELVDHARVLFSESAGFPPPRHLLAGRSLAVKVIVPSAGSSMPEQYAMLADPLEEHPAYVEGDAFEAARARYDAECQQLRRVLAVGAETAPAPLGAEREQKLRALGYVQ